MRSRIFALYLALIPSIAIPANGQSPEGANKKIPVNLLLEDLRTLRTKLESSQPGLYLYTGKDSLGRIFDQLSGSIHEPMTGVEFYRKIAPINQSIRNVHNVFWASVAYEKDTETGLRFPLDIHWDEKMYVLRNHSNDQSIAQGAVISRINGQDAGVIFQTLMEGVMRDGWNETYPVAKASRLFGYFYSELIGAPDAFTVDFINPDGIEQTVQLPGMSAAEIKSSRVSKYKGKYSQYGEDWDAWIKEKKPALGLEMKGTVAIMTLRTFHTYTIEGGGQNYEEFIVNAFRQLADSHATDLIIDMRNNHGGHDLVGMALMSHLHDSSFYYYKRRSALVKPIGKYKKKGIGYEIVGRGGWIGKVDPAAPVYSGKVYVLINGYSVSAAAEFIGHLKNAGRAVFIGEETGGNPVIFTGGQTLYFDLPHSHVTGIIPLHLVEMNVSLKNTGHGVVPDYRVKPGITDILQEKDVELDFAMKLIKEKRGN